MNRLNKQQLEAIIALNDMMVHHLGSVDITYGVNAEIAEFKLRNSKTRSDEFNCVISWRKRDDYMALSLNGFVPYGFKFGETDALCAYVNRHNPTATGKVLSQLVREYYAERAEFWGVTDVTSR